MPVTGRLYGEGGPPLGWSERSPLFRARLRTWALRYASHGWAVVPGAWLSDGRFDCGRPGCLTIGCHPASDRWDQEATAEPKRVAAWWRRHPRAVLLATGRSFDVLDVPAYLGVRVLGAARGRARWGDSRPTSLRGPVAVTPSGRWLFLVSPGDPLHPELAQCPDIVRHGPGSWIPAPPTVLPEGPVRWAVTPDETRWRLPESWRVQGTLLEFRKPTAAVTSDARLACPVPRLGRAG